MTTLFKAVIHLTSPQYFYLFYTALSLPPYMIYIFIVFIIYLSLFFLLGCKLHEAKIFVSVTICLSAYNSA